MKLKILGTCIKDTPLFSTLQLLRTAKASQGERRHSSLLRNFYSLDVITQPNNRKYKLTELPDSLPKTYENFTWVLGRTVKDRWRIWKRKKTILRVWIKTYQYG